MSDLTALFDAARQVRLQAHAPYSGFQVGAAIRTDDGAIHVGCNVENVAYPEGTCAEAGAVAAMCAAGGSRRIRAVAVIADGPAPVTPCGGCRQKLAEFGGADTVVAMATLSATPIETRLSSLLPGAFSAAHMADQD